LIAFVEIQERIEFSLAGEQLLQPLLVFERAFRLCLVVRNSFSMRATRLCWSAASLSRFLNVCSMLWIVPTGFAGFNFAEYVACPRTNRSGMRSSSWSNPNPPLLPPAENLEAPKKHRAAASSDRHAT
jgi:hypothetical protein